MRGKRFSFMDYIVGTVGLLALTVIFLLGLVPSIIYFGWTHWRNKNGKR
jgi:hypothetical protein